MADARRKKPRLSASYMENIDTEESEVRDGWTRHLSSSEVLPSPRRPKESWDKARQAVNFVLYCPVPRTDVSIFGVAVTVVVLVNMGVMIVETDYSAACVELEALGEDCFTPSSILILNVFFLSVYTIECSLRLFVFRCMYFETKQNCLDLFVVIAGFIGYVGLSEQMAKVMVLRIVRITRTLRILKVLRYFKTLNAMVDGMLGALDAMVSGLILTFCLLVVWAMIAAELLNPINYRLTSGPDGDEQCKGAFETVGRSTLYFFHTLVAGDSWGRCAMPIIKDSPWTIVIFACSLVTVQLGFLNLVLAVIVDKAAEARAADNESRERQRREEEIKGLHMWRTVFNDLDKDKSGTITEDELRVGMVESHELKETMRGLGIEPKDLRHLFELMDTEGDGAITYEDMVDTFVTAKVMDPSAYQMLLQCRVAKMDVQLPKKMDELHDAIMARFEQVARGTARGRPPNGQPPTTDKQEQVLGRGSARDSSEDADTMAAILHELKHLRGRVDVISAELARSRPASPRALASDQVRLEDVVLATRRPPRQPMASFGDDDAGMLL